MLELLPFVILNGFCLIKRSIVVHMGYYVVSNFNIHIWACTGDFVINTNRWLGDFVLI